MKQPPKTSTKAGESPKSTLSGTLEKLAVGGLDLVVPFGGTLAEIGLDLYRRGTERAEEEAARVFDTELREQVMRQAATVEDLEASVALLSRLVNEAGRHPEREMQRALGGLGARLAFADKTLSRKFVVAEVASQLSAMDVALLVCLRNAELAEAAACNDGSVRQGSGSWIVAGYLWTGLREAGYSVTPREADQAIARLQSLQLLVERQDTANVVQHHEYASTRQTAISVRSPTGLFNTTDLADEILTALGPRGLGDPPLKKWDSEGHFKASALVLDGTGRTAAEVEADELANAQLH